MVSSTARVSFESPSAFSSSLLLSTSDALSTGSSLPPCHHPRDPLKRGKLFNKGFRSSFLTVGDPSDGSATASESPPTDALSFFMDGLIQRAIPDSDQIHWCFCSGGAVSIGVLAQHGLPKDVVAVSAMAKKLEQAIAISVTGIP